MDESLEHWTVPPSRCIGAVWTVGSTEPSAARRAQSVTIRRGNRRSTAPPDQVRDPNGDQGRIDGGRLAIARNSTGLRIGIPRKGCRTSRSASPVMRWLALPLNANARNLLSFGSRQSVSTSRTSTTSASCTKAERNSKRRASDRYLSNFFRRSTSSNSATVASDTSNRPPRGGQVKCLPWSERGSTKAHDDTGVDDGSEITRHAASTPASGM